MGNIFQSYIFSEKMGEYFILPNELQDIAFKRLKLIDLDFNQKYMLLSTTQIKQITCSLLNYLLAQFKQISTSNQIDLIKLKPFFYTIFKHNENLLDRNDKKQRLLFVANACYYFLNEAMGYDDIKVYFTTQAEEECPEVRQILTQPIQKQVDIDKIPALKTNLFSFSPASNELKRESKYQPITYQVLGHTGTSQVLLDQKYGYVQLSLNMDNSEKVSGLIFVNTSAKKFFQTLEKIKHFAQKIEHKSDLLEKAKCFLQLKKEIWLIDKTIGTRTEPSLWKDIFFPELDGFYTQLLEKHLEQRKEKQNITIKSALHIRLSQPLIF